MARFEFAATDVAEYAGQGGGADALYELGLMYSTGRDVEPDMVEAHKWFNLAALRGNDDAKRLRQDIARLMTRAEVTAAQKRAREWLAIH